MSESLTLSQVEDALHMHGYKHKRAGNTVLTQCPKHEGEDLNCQINANGYCTCYSHCGGYWLDEVFTELKDDKYKKGEYVKPTKVIPRKEQKYVKRDYYSLWEGLPKLSTKLSEPLKGVLPIANLDKLGWRWIENGPHGLGTGVFIPYWDSSYDDEGEQPVYPKRLNFCQVRHLDGPVRFNFPRDAEPTIYGSWVLGLAKGDDMPVFLCEGTTDWCTLWENCVPAVALPSSSAKTLICRVAKWCRDNGLTIVYAGDNDAAGDKLRQALDDGEYSYRICQPPSKYSDWTDFYIAEGSDALFKHVRHLTFPETDTEKTDDVSKILDVFPDAVQLELK